MKDISSRSVTTNDSKPVVKILKPRKVLIREFSDSDVESEATLFNPDKDPFKRLD